MPLCDIPFLSLPTWSKPFPWVQIWGNRSLSDIGGVGRRVGDQVGDAAGEGRVRAVDLHDRDVRTSLQRVRYGVVRRLDRREEALGPQEIVDHRAEGVGDELHLPDLVDDERRA